MASLVPIAYENGRPTTGRDALGRCPECGAAWSWPRGAGRLGDARCPDCGAPLSQTTRLLRSPFRIVTAATWRAAQAAIRQQRAEAVDRIAADAVTFGRRP